MCPGPLAMGAEAGVRGRRYMINKQRVKRIRNVIYTVMVILLFLPIMLLIALAISMIGFMKDASDSLKNIETYMSGEAVPVPLQAEGQSVAGQAGDIEAYDPADAPDEEKPDGGHDANNLGEAITPAAISGGEEPAELLQEPGQGQGGGGGAPDGLTPNGYRPEAFPSLYFDTLPSPTASGVNELYLTIDNTPSANFSAIMDVLGKHNVKATFFVWRGDSGGAPSLGSDYRAILQAGHSIGIHCGEPSIPLSALYSSVDFFLADFAMMFDTIEAQTGVRTRLYRLPGGSVNPHNPARTQMIRNIKAELDSRGFIQHDWNASAQDAVNPPLSMQQILSNLHTSIQRGDHVVALVHDGTGSDSTVRALDEFIPYCLEQGYVFRALDYNTVPVSFIAQ